MIKKNDNIEVRSASIETTTGRTVEGYAALFDSPSHDIGWIEVLKPDCITEELIQDSDVFCKFNHNDDIIFARSKYGQGSLELTLDEKGLKYRFEAPNTMYGDELLEHLRRGEITTSSFAFWIDENDPDAQKWYTEGGVTYREIYHIAGLVDVSPVWQEAYPETSVYARNKAAAMKEEIDNALKHKYDSMLSDIDAISDTSNIFDNL